MLFQRQAGLAAACSIGLQVPEIRAPAKRRNPLSFGEGKPSPGEAFAGMSRWRKAEATVSFESFSRQSGGERANGSGRTDREQGEGRACCSQYLSGRAARGNPCGDCRGTSSGQTVRRTRGDGPCTDSWSASGSGRGLFVLQYRLVPTGIGKDEAWSREPARLFRAGKRTG